MDIRDEAGAIAVGLRTVRLPRVMRVVYPRDPDMLASTLQKGDCFLVAETSKVVRAYLCMRFDAGPANAWVTDLAVGRFWRRQKLGSALLGEAYSRARDQRMRLLTVETQTKNYPGIVFCQKQGLSFCGFNDRYYPNHDIALFFGQNVRG
jgi:ribosomal protein S18 acetylase RimI-like enzyme